MTLAIYRLPNFIFIELLIAAAISWCIGYIPNWQRTAYRKTEPVKYCVNMHNDMSGYPAGDDYPEIKCIADTDKSDNFVLIIDRTQLKETHTYRGLHDSSYTRSRVLRALLNNEMKNGMGQFYVATLESGERVLVLLDDTTIELPDEGQIILPVGRRINVNSGKSFGKLVKREGIEGDAANIYLDMGSAWRNSREAKDGNVIGYVLVFSFVIIMILENIILFKVILKGKEI